ncbi:flavodoxin domain-containing protein [Tessaracoccus lapidicaptus]|uniref:flavodoxin domain-containing protein n=1 Tax=Tessaracoccus lapidicaptus TaxID=1427523 RepID=UPI00333ECD12
MGRVLVAYATRGGAARDIAETVGEVLRASGHAVRVADLKSKPGVDGAELVVLGSGINAGSWYPEATSWLAAEAGALRAARVAVFNACLNAADPAKRDDSLAYNRSVAERVRASASESFAGRFVPEHISWWRRLFLRTMQKPTQDHLDLDAVRAWASTLTVS